MEVVFCSDSFVNLIQYVQYNNALEQNMERKFCYLHILSSDFLCNYQYILKPWQRKSLPDL